ncbi:hypothetical protein Q1695_004134 [Nippostrongylus brasiliensis]|nr:hypothetical protein Q1695_004134 [Nippostrongylus brasiliensis]
MFLTAETDFATKLLQQATYEESLVISPISLLLTLAMVQAGAKGTTKSQISNAISKGSSDSTIQSYYSNLSQEFLKQGNDVKTKIANGMFLSKQYTPSKSYVDAINGNYSATVQTLDFGNADAAARTINGYVYKNTAGKINAKVRADTVKGSSSLLVSAIYFNAKWLNPFNKSLTAVDTFYSAQQEYRQIPFMIGIRTELYSEDDELKVLSLPFKDGAYSFVMILPKMMYYRIDLRPKFTVARFQRLISQLKRTTVYCQIPRLQFDTEYNATEPLTSLGVSDMFSNKSDLSGITPGQPLKVSGVIHRAVMQVDEDGVTSSAPMVSAKPYKEFPDGGPMDVFQANIPFWFIVTKSGNPLFIGQYA